MLSLRFWPHHETSPRPDSSLSIKHTHTHNTPSHIPPPGFISGAPPALSTARLQACTSLSWWTAVACSAFPQPPSPLSSQRDPWKVQHRSHPFTLTVVLISVHGAQSDAYVSQGSACPDSCSPLHLLSPPPPLLCLPSCPLGRPLLTLLVSDQVSPLQRNTPAPHTRPLHLR